LLASHDLIGVVQEDSKGLKREFLDLDPNAGLPQFTRAQSASKIPKRTTAGPETDVLIGEGVCPKEGDQTSTA
jgi:hypothetical protein